MKISNPAGFQKESIKNCGRKGKQKCVNETHLNIFRGRVNSLVPMYCNFAIQNSFLIFDMPRIFLFF